MTLAVERQIDALESGLRGWLRASRDPDADVTALVRPSDGLSSETLMVDTRVRNQAERIVVRLPPVGEGAFPTYDLDVQAHAQTVAAAAGVPIAAPVELVTDDRWLGDPFLVMPAVAGPIPGQTPAIDPWLGSMDDTGRRDVQRAAIDAMTGIHSVTPGSTALTPIPYRDVGRELQYWRGYLDWYADGAPVVPALDDALGWCEDHRPVSEPAPTLLWGDVRLGNLIFDDDRRVRAVLDWEMTTIGAPEHDLAWYLALGAIQDELFGRSVAGFEGRSRLVARFEAAVGREAVDLEWFEVLAIVRSTAIMTRIAVLHERVGKPNFFPIADNPIVDILRRRIAAIESRRPGA